MAKNSVDEEMHYKLIQKIESNPHASQRELAKELGVSLGKINYCLKALVGVGLVKVGNFARAQNKMDYAYCLTPAGVKAKARLTKKFLEKKQRQYEELKAEIDQLKKDAASLTDSGS